ncbi:hypothetical protein O5623_17635 [Escherichia coli]|nr:hypothetical protein [Escherichia coli]
MKSAKTESDRVRLQPDMEHLLAGLIAIDAARAAVLCNPGAHEMSVMHYLQDKTFQDIVKESGVIVPVCHYYSSHSTVHTAS